MKSHIIFFILFIFITSCEKVVTDELSISKNEPLLVVEGGIEHHAENPIPVQKIRLTTTTDFLDNTPPPVVENATVGISSAGNIYELAYEGDGVYATEQIMPQIGQSYTLNIRWEDKTYSAVDQLNEVPKIDSIYTEFEEETGITDEGYFVKFNSKDPAGIANYYYYRVYRNDSLFVLPDPGNSRTIILKDEFFDGQNRVGVVPNEEVIYEIGDIAKVDQIGISAEYYQYLFEFYRQTGYQGVSFTGNPPPATIRGNVISDSPEDYRALGFFRAIDVKTKWVEVN